LQPAGVRVGGAGGAGRVAGRVRRRSASTSIAGILLRCREPELNHAPLSGLEVDDQLELRGLHDGLVRRFGFGPHENSADIDAGLTMCNPAGLFP